jgi:hypothetical protein
MAVVVDERERGDGLVHEKVCLTPLAFPVFRHRIVLTRTPPAPTC